MVHAGCPYRLDRGEHLLGAGDDVVNVQGTSAATTLHLTFTPSTVPMKPRSPSGPAGCYGAVSWCVPALVREWAKMYETDLLAAWTGAQTDEPLHPIPPLK